MRPIGIPIKVYQVMSRNDFNLPVGSEVWAFSKGNYYMATTVVRDNRFEIRIHNEITNFSEIETCLTQMEDYS
jgi:hypothetical protein